MKQNVGVLDKLLRFTLGTTLLLSGLFLWGGLSGGIFGIVAAVLGVVLLGTAAMGLCLVYLPFGISTCKTEAKK